MELTVSASYDDLDRRVVKKAIFSAIEEDARILKEPAPFVSITAYGDSAILLYCTRLDVERQLLGRAVSLTEAIRDAFERHGVTMTYNHLNVHLIEKERRRGRPAGNGAVEKGRPRRGRPLARGGGWPAAAGVPGIRQQNF